MSGVYGQADGSNGYGVYGHAPGASGWGVVGRALGTSGKGVYGEAPQFGVHGRATDPGGWGIYGEATEDGELANIGGRFIARGKTGAAVVGSASNTANAINYGGYFERAETPWYERD